MNNLNETRLNKDILITTSNILSQVIYGYRNLYCVLMLILRYYGRGQCSSHRREKSGHLTFRGGGNQEGGHTME